ACTSATVCGSVQVVCGSGTTASAPPTSAIAPTSDAPAPTSPRWARLKSALIYAAGPGSELALLAALIAWLGFDTVFNTSDELALVALKSLAIVILFGAWFNLMPYTLDNGVSDGLGILLSPFVSSESIERRLLTLEEMDVEEVARDGRTDEAIERLDALIDRGLQVDRLRDKAVAILATAGRYQEARTRLDERLDGHPIVEVDDIGLLHLDALTELAAEQPDPVKVDLSLNRALRRVPDNASLKTTRGIADIRRGRTVHGANRLADVYRDIDNPVDTARALGWLAVAAKRVGHAEATRKFMEAFEHMNQDAGLKASVERGMSSDYQ
ncbi:MAG: hypothetical protein AAFU65_12175, partial [Pseudomonadota bacterium]